MDEEVIKTAKFLDEINDKIKGIFENPIIFLSLIGITAFLFRLYFLPNLPFTQDAIAYFQYANDLAVLHSFPSSFSYLESGWPMFLSIFISTIVLENFMDYVYLQRLITVSISVITIIPLYLLSKKIFDSKSLASISTILFVFEPHIVNNSLQGLSEPIFILLSTITIFFFLSHNQKIFYSSFVTVAFLTIVRTQGIILFLIMMTLMLIFEKKDKKIIAKYALVILIFCLVLLPIISLRTQGEGNDLLVGRITGVVSDISVEENNRNENITDIITKGGEVLGKRIFQTMSPFFIIFVPFGILMIFQERNRLNMSIILTVGITLIFSIYIFWASTDIRNIFWLYPLFGIISVFTIRKMTEGTPFPSLAQISIIGGIVLVSWFYLFSSAVDVTHEEEALKIAYYLSESTQVINHFLPESGYLAIKPLEEVEKFPVMHTSISSTIPKALEIHKSNKSIFTNLEEFVLESRDEGLTHIVTDLNSDRPEYLKELFHNEEKYPYLEKVFDSRENGYAYHVKVFKIIYEKFDELHNNG